MKYAIIVGGIVTNIAEAELPLASNWVRCGSGVAIGDLFDGNLFKSPPKPTEPQAQPVTPAMPVYQYAAPSVKVNAQSWEFNPAFFIQADDSLVIEADLVSGTGEQLAFSTASNISTPIVQHAGGKPIANELYFSTSITNGHVVMQGRLPSGDWKLLPERINQALKFINAPFEVALAPITFIVSTPA